MPSMTKDDLIPLVDKICELTGKHFFLDQHKDGYFALNCEDKTMRFGMGHRSISLVGI